MQYLEHILKAHPAIPNYIHSQLLGSVFCSQVLGPGVKLEELQLDVLELSVVRKPQREVVIYTPKQAGDGPEFRGAIRAMGNSPTNWWYLGKSMKIIEVNGDMEDLPASRFWLPEGKGILRSVWRVRAMFQSFWKWWFHGNMESGDFIGMKPVKHVEGWG